MGKRRVLLHAALDIDRNSSSSTIELSASIHRCTWRIQDDELRLFPFDPNCAMHLTNISNEAWEVVGRPEACSRMES